jgi:hypothetical protein
MHHAPSKEAIAGSWCGVDGKNAGSVAGVLLLTVVMPTEVPEVKNEHCWATEPMEE